MPYEEVYPMNEDNSTPEDYIGSIIDNLVGKEQEPTTQQETAPVQPIQPKTKTTKQTSVQPVIGQVQPQAVQTATKPVQQVGDVNNGMSVSSMTYTPPEAYDKANEAYDQATIRYAEAIPEVKAEDKIKSMMDYFDLNAPSRKEAMKELDKRYTTSLVSQALNNLFRSTGEAIGNTGGRANVKQADDRALQASLQNNLARMSQNELAQYQEALQKFQYQLGAKERGDSEAKTWQMNRLAQGQAAYDAALKNQKVTVDTKASEADKTRRFTAEEKAKDRKNAKEVAASRNAATIKAATIRGDKEDGEDFRYSVKNVYKHDDGNKYKASDLINKARRKYKELKPETTDEQLNELFGYKVKNEDDDKIVIMQPYNDTGYSQVISKVRNNNPYLINEVIADMEAEQKFRKLYNK